MRLKVGTITIAIILDKFQFQIGAIKSNEKTEILRLNTLFQFQIGAIKSHQVRILICRYPMFQFQIGAIKSIIETVYKDHAKSGSFNSKLVRLKGCKQHFMTNDSKLVSIPNWCD